MITLEINKLQEWAKGKIAILNEFRMLLRVPYDMNLYSIISTVQEKMFKRRQQIVDAAFLMKDVSILLDRIIMPIYKIEIALNIIQDGKKPIDKFKLDYFLRLKRDDRDFENLKKFIRGEELKDSDSQPKTYVGVLERIGF